MSYKYGIKVYVSQGLTLSSLLYVVPVIQLPSQIIVHIELPFHSALIENEYPTDHESSKKYFLISRDL